ncbi:MAG: site-2 protease family protein [Acidobacteriota bacterium]
MKWSWKLGRIAGIDVYVHATFLLLVGWVGLVHWSQGRTLAAGLMGVGFILALFGCVLLHEFGHALTAKRYGIRTRDITLLPIGGLARLERMPDDPRQELWVALAGPAVNVVIAAALYAWLALTAGLEPLESLGVARGAFLDRLMVLNVVLVLFNMLPAFPMDGGRVLRAVLARWMEYTRATRIAAKLGRGMAILFGILGLLIANPFLLFIALFVWMGAAQESGLVQVRAAFAGIPVGRAMITDFQSLSPGDSLGRVAELILAGSQHDFPVVEAGHVVGVLTRDGLLKALARRGEDSRVAEVMQRDFQVVDSSDMLGTAFQRLQACKCRTLPVVHWGELVGLVTMDNIGEFVMIQSALGSAKTRGQG